MRTRAARDDGRRAPRRVVRDRQRRLAGIAAPLPYVPLANPLDVTLIAALAALFAWARRFERLDEPTLYGWFGVALFLFVNAFVFRAVHQWADVPWRWSALLASNRCRPR